MYEKEEISKLLIVVDMVNGFVRKGSLHDERIEDIIPENVRLVKDFLNNEEGVIFFKDCHSLDSIEFNSFPSHCLKDDYESEIVDELIGFSEFNTTYEKNSTSGIFAPRFLNDIEKMKKLREVIVTGCCTDICVMNLAIPLKNYFNEKNKDIDLIIPENAVSTYDNPNGHDALEYSDMAFKLMKLNGVKVVNRYEVRK